MDMLRTLHLLQTGRHSGALQLLHKPFTVLERSDFIPIAMDDESRYCVFPGLELRHGADGVDFPRGGRRGEGGVGEAVEHDAQAVRFFEEGQDELGAGVAGADPAEVGAVCACGGIVGCDLCCEVSILFDDI